MIETVVFDGTVALKSRLDAAISWIDAHLPTQRVASRGTGWSGDVAIVADARLYRAISVTIDQAQSRSAVRLYLDEQYDYAAVGARDVYLMRPGAAESIPHALVGSYDGGWQIVLPSVDSREARQSLRSLRSILRAHHLDAGAMLVHSACAAGVLFVGPSSAGKTSSALRLAQLAAPLISTDRTTIRRDPTTGKPLAIGGPEVVRLGVALANELNADVLRHGSRTRRQRSLVELDVLTDEFGSKRKLELTFADVWRDLNIESADSAIVRAVAFPQATDTDAKLVRLDAADALPLVCDQLLHPDPTHGYPLAKRMMSRAQACASLRNLFGDVAFYELRWPVHDAQRRAGVFGELAALTRVHNGA